MTCREDDIREAGVLFFLGLSAYFMIIAERVITFMSIRFNGVDSTNDWIRLFISIATVVGTITLFYLRIIEYKWMGEINVCRLNTVHLSTDAITISICVCTRMLEYKYFWFYLVFVVIAYIYDAYVNVVVVISPKLIRSGYRGRVVRIHCYTHAVYNKCCEL